MTGVEIKTYLESFNNELIRLHSKREICLYGGAVMCLVYDARPNNKDVDAIFQPVESIRIAIENVAQQYDLRSDWLRDAAVLIVLGIFGGEFNGQSFYLRERVSSVFVRINGGGNVFQPIFQLYPSKIYSDLKIRI